MSEYIHDKLIPAMLKTRNPKACGRKKHSTDGRKLTKNKTRMDGKTERYTTGTVGERLFVSWQEKG
jgi:hypothetical protein